MRLKISLDKSGLIKKYRKDRLLINIEENWMISI
jgi:hypothetical protein